MTAETATAHLSVPATRTNGRLCLWAGLLGAVSGVFLAVVPASVGSERFSYPLDAAGFTMIQVWFVVQHIGLILGLTALWSSGAAGAGRLGRYGHYGAVAGMTALTVVELAAIGAANMNATTTYVGVLEACYGIASTLIGVGLVMAGIAVIRTRLWRGWRRALPLVMGVWVFVPMFPALSISFLSARLAISAWMLLFALLGWVLSRDQS